MVAFPVVATVSSGSSGLGTTHTGTLPTGVASGDLLIYFFTRLNATTTTWPSGWSSLISNTASDYAFEVRYRYATGSDTAPSLTTSGTTASNYKCLRITGTDGVTAPAATTVATATSTAPDSTSLSPSWGSADTLWLSGISFNATAAPTAYPANYSGASVSGTYGPTLTYGTRGLTGASENPGAWTLGSSVVWFAATLAVRPVAAAQGAAALAGVATLGATAVPIVGAAQLAAVAALSAAAALPGSAAAFAAVSALGAVVPVPKSTATLTASASLGGDLKLTPFGTVALPAAAALSATPVPPGATLTAVALLSPSPVSTGVSGSILAAVAVLSAPIFTYYPVSVNLSATASLGASVFTFYPGNVALNAVAALRPGTTLPGAASALPATATLTAGVQLFAGGGGLFLTVTAVLVADPTAFKPLFVIPSGPVVPRIRIPFYRLYAANTRTGRIGWELPFTSVSWNNPINAAGSLQATVVIEDTLDVLQSQGALDPRATLREVLGGPYRFSLVLAWGRQVVFAGPYLPSSVPGNKPTAEVGAGELSQLFTKRIVLAPGWVYPSDPSATVSLGPASRPAILKGIIDAATTGYGRELPITCANPPIPSGNFTRSYYGFDATMTSDALADLTAEDGGPDYRLDPYLVQSSDGLYVKWELNIGNPYLGTGVTPWTFDDSSTIVTLEVDATRMASTYFVPGNGQNEQKLFGVATNTALIDQGFPALDAVDGSYSSVLYQDILNSHAAADVARYSVPVNKWSLKVQADGDPMLGSFRVGDPMLVDVRRHPVIASGTYPRRITEISGDHTPWVTVSSTDSTAVATPVPLNN